VRIKPTWFRSFGDRDWINLDSDLVILHGPNGYGKTSIAESIEWLIYGKTKRRIKGEKLSKRDYQGSYRNAHAPTGSLTSVEAVIRLSDGLEHSIKRELVIGHRKVESSNTFIDNNPGNLSSIGISDDEIYDSIIAQDSLKDFIYSEP